MNGMNVQHFYFLYGVSFSEFWPGAEFPMIPQQGPSAPFFAMYNEKHVPRLPLFKFRVSEFDIANTMMLVTLRFGLPGLE